MEVSILKPTLQMMEKSSIFYEQSAVGDDLQPGANLTDCRQLRTHSACVSKLNSAESHFLPPPPTYHLFVFTLTYTDYPMSGVRQ